MGPCTVRTAMLGVCMCVLYISLEGEKISLGPNFRYAGQKCSRLAIFKNYFLFFHPNISSYIHDACKIQPGKLIFNY